MTLSRPEIRARLQAVQTEIAREASRCGRDPASVQLLCVSKTQPVEAIEPVLETGHCLFGENRVQEAAQKWPLLRAHFSGVELHLIGPLQSNKAKEAVDLFDVIETVDRPRIAEALAREIQKAGKQPRLFVEVNTGKEAQKAGILPEDVDLFLEQCRKTYGLKIDGLMCIPPHNEQAAPHFAFLAQMAKRNGLPELSMGMTADYPVAIQLGATIVRVGTAIFGDRTIESPV